MSNLDAITRLRKKQPKKEKLVVFVESSALTDLINLHRERPSFTAGMVVSDAVRFALNNGMYQFSTEFADPTAKRKTIEVSKSQVALLMDKVGWCAKYGGTEADGICVYDKFEVTPSGVIMKNKQSQAIKAMPDTEEDFRRSIIGAFVTVSEAEMNYEKQSEVGTVEDRVLGRKK